MSSYPFSLFIDAATSRREVPWRASVRKRDALSILVAMAGVISLLPPVALGQQFTDVSTQAGMVAFATRSWGNPQERKDKAFSESLKESERAA